MKKEIIDKKIDDDTMKYIVKYMNRIYLGKGLQESMNKEIERLMTEAGLTRKEQERYWDFYQNKENRKFDKNDEVISFKPFRKGM